MLKFEIGKTYSTTSICNSDCVFSYKVVKRTTATVTMINKFGEQKTYRINKKVSEYRKAESIFPEGNYSMCPVLSADKEVA